MDGFIPKVEYVKNNWKHVLTEEQLKMNKEDAIAFVKGIHVC